jgi:hypothetical protein
MGFFSGTFLGICLGIYLEICLEICLGILPGNAAALGTQLTGISIASTAGRQAGKKSGNLCVQGCLI